jgi:hypothetical protein
VLERDRGFEPLLLKIGAKNLLQLFAEFIIPPPGFPEAICSV